MIEPEDSKEHVAAFSRAVGEGLASEPKTLPWTYLYDEEGSRLFEDICRLPEYYLTRTEDAILKREAKSIVSGWELGSDELEMTIVELGSGSAVKTQRLISAGLDRFAGFIICRSTYRPRLWKSPPGR